MDIPMRWCERFAGARLERQAIGASRADVFRVHCSNGETLFLKSELCGSGSELADEVERLRWLRQRGLPGPAVLDVAAEGERRWLLMSAVPGCDLASAAGLSPSQVIRLVALALRRLHEVPIAACPFDHRLELRMAAARERLGAGLVDEANFDKERQGRTAVDVFTELTTLVPTAHDLVVAHGDACLPNLMADAGRFTGFIDCGRLGTSDRFQDLALAARSIERNLGREWVQPFFQEYGVAADAQRIAFYVLLDEFF